MHADVLSGRALALAVLAWSLLKVTLDRAFGAKTGIALFRENYDDDRLPPIEARTSARAWQRSRGASRAAAATWARPSASAASRGAYAGVMSIVLASSRRMPDFDAAPCSRSITCPTPCSPERRASQVPTSVPFRELAWPFVRAKASVRLPVVAR